MLFYSSSKLLYFVLLIITVNLKLDEAKINSSR